MDVVVAPRYLVALDLDGTTVNHDGELSPAVAAAVTELVAAGHLLIIATGRSIVATMPLVAELGLGPGYAVCSNGAVTVALDPGRDGGYEIVELVTFDPKAALTLLREAIPDALVAVEDPGIGFKVNAPFSLRSNSTISVSNTQVSPRWPNSAPSVFDRARVTHAMTVSLLCGRKRVGRSPCKSAVLPLLGRRIGVAHEWSVSSRQDPHRGEATEVTSTVDAHSTFGVMPRSTTCGSRARRREQRRAPVDAHRRLHPVRKE